MTDRFRKEYRRLTPDEQTAIENIKTQAVGLDALLSEVKDARCRALAITKLEECVMWATKGLTG